MLGKKKKIEKICNNCLLFDRKNGVCNVIILHEGQKIKIPVEPEDKCFFEEEYYNPITQRKETFSEEIKQVRLWVENEKGEQIEKDGIVKIEYPEGFFGDVS